MRDCGKVFTLGKDTEPQFVMSDDVLAGSLLTLCELLHRHYGQKVVLLIDEYELGIRCTRTCC